MSSLVRGRGLSSSSGHRPPARIALDLLGGDAGSQVMLAAVAALLSGSRSGHAPATANGVLLVLVGPADAAKAALRALGIDPAHPALSYVPAQRVVDMSEAPVAALRAHSDIGVRVAAELVRDGDADAIVTAGHTGAAVVATSLVWGRQSGVARPVLATTVPGIDRPVLLLDVGATTDASPGVLASHAAVGLRAAVSQGLCTQPRLGLLSIGAERGKGDQLRRATEPLLRSTFPTQYVGLVEGDDVVHGGRADVVVTDGFTGNVLLKGLEGALRWAVAVTGGAYDDPGPARHAIALAVRPPYGAGLLLGVRGIAVLAHGSATVDGMLTAIEVARCTVHSRELPPARSAGGDGS